MIAAAECGRTVIGRRRLLAGASATAGAALMLPGLALPLAAQAAASLDYRLDPHEIADGVWLFEGAQQSFAPENGGAICNIVMVQTASGAVVIDSGGTARHGAALRVFADQRMGGVAAVVNTHHHPDHWFGNQAFDDRPIIALPASRQAQTDSAQDLADGLYRILGAWMTGTAPRPATEDAMAGEWRVGGRSFGLYALAGHSQADLVIRDEQTGTLVAGDILFLNRAPSLPDADIPRWQSAISQIAAIPVSGIVPGHGPFHRDSRAMGQTQHYLSGFDARMRGATNNGLTQIEAIAAGAMPDYAHLGANPEEYRRSVIQRWRDYETRTLPVISGG